MKILGFGQVLWDYTVYADFSFLENLGYSLAGHFLVDNETLEEVIKEFEENNAEIIKNSGGSCANLMSNMAKLGTPSAFCGKHGNDEDGRSYMDILRKEGVEPHGVIDEEHSTGKLLSIITPDKERTFIVYWGAASVLPQQVVNEDLIKSAEIVHLEGYLVVNSQEFCWKAFEHAQNITFDLAAYTVIERTRPVLQKMFRKYQPLVLFANLQEGKMLTRKDSTDDILDGMLEYTKTAVLTLGEKGVMIKTQEGEHCYQEAIPTEPMDTTGAGDSFAAGFLHEFLNNGDITKAAALGVRTASATISKLGARSLQLAQLK
jgi:sugar/nucleoside kinase (ribokinase family)